MNVNSAFRAAGCGIFLSLVAFPVFAADKEPPSTPPNFSATSLSASSVQLSWDESTDNKRVKNYRLRRDGASILIAGKLTYIDYGLLPSTTYTYEVVASDGFNTSTISSLTVSTLSTDDEPPIVENPDSGPGKGRGKNKNTPTEEPPTEEPPTEEPPQGSGAPEGWNLVFSDDFIGSGDIDISSADRNWRFETMQDGLHRAGNTGIDASGNMVADWDSVRGKRWSGWYDKFNAANAYRDTGLLVLSGIDSGELDPTRPIDYIDNGTSTTYGQSKLYTAWIDTWSRTWVGPNGEHVVDPQSPAKAFKYGYFETRVNFSEMITPGFRLSMWLMPASNDAAGQDLVVSTAYDSDGNNGVEIDLFEYEWISSDRENLIQLSVHGGSAGSSATGFDTTSLGINLHEGYHTIGFLWQPDKMVWSIDGHAVKEVSNVDLIPDVYSYLIISREMNSGVKNPDIDNIENGDMLEEWPYIPRDPGLFAKNIWEFRNSINIDRALVDYVRIWQP